MTTAQIIQFPANRVSSGKPSEPHMAGPAQIIIFSGDRWERLPSKQSGTARATRGNQKQAN